MIPLTLGVVALLAGEQLIHADTTAQQGSQDGANGGAHQNLRIAGIPVQLLFQVVQGGNGPGAAGDTAAAQYQSAAGGDDWALS